MNHCRKFHSVTEADESLIRGCVFIWFCNRCKPLKQKHLKLKRWHFLPHWFYLDLSRSLSLCLSLKHRNFWEFLVTFEKPGLSWLVSICIFSSWKSGIIYFSTWKNDALERTNQMHYLKRWHKCIFKLSHLLESPQLENEVLNHKIKKAISRKFLVNVHVDSHNTLLK